MGMLVLSVTKLSIEGLRLLGSRLSIGVSDLRFQGSKFRVSRLRVHETT